MHAFLLGKYQGEEWWAHTADACFYFLKNENGFPKWLYHLHSHQQWVRVWVPPHFPQTLAWSALSPLATLTDVQW